MKRRHLLSVATAALPGAALAQSGAQSGAWPQRPINMIVAFPAGGGTDVAARTVARFLERELGQPIVVNNRGGAAGDIGWTEMARSQPDGYTIGFINTPNVLTNPIERRTSYSLDNFAPIANIVDDPSSFFVKGDSPLRNVADLVAYARANPDSATYGTTGIGSDDHLAALALERVAGIKLTHVPFTGAAPVRTAVLGGQIMIGSMNMGEGIADMRNGQLRPLGQMSETRWSEAAEVPTFREQGFDLVQSSMRGLAAPAGVPAEVRTRLAQATEATIRNPEFRRLAAQQALPLRFLGPDEYATVLREERGRLEALWRAHPWKE
ncbi:tripartite tricarboxylate transporter substrate binding protein [Rhodovarius crocodyli]|nr:tripartite tricarboxylate transporter substrate binding protein [Rhodovarius crocodyli]